MDISINGKTKSFEEASLTVTELFEKENVQMPEMVSLEVNGEFLDREAFEATIVKDGDKVEFLYFMGGGNLK